MNTIKDFLKITAIPLLVSAFIIFVAFISRFPEGYIFAAHDFSYPLDIQKYIESYSYLWNNYYLGLGEYTLAYSAIPFYILVNFLKNLFNLGNSGQSIIFYALFYLSSFWGFYISVKLFDSEKALKSWQSSLIGLAYTFNPYTFYIFYFQYGFTPFLYLYAFFPVYLGLLHRYMESRNSTENMKYLSLLGVVAFLTNITNSNTPFFFSMNVLLAAYLIAYLTIHRKDRIFKKNIRKILAYYVVYALSVVWSVLPLVTELHRGYAAFITGDSIYSLKDWMLTHRLTFLDIFTIHPPFIQYYYYSEKFGYYALSLILCLLFFLSYLLSRKPNKTMVLLSIVFVVDIFLANKGKGVLPDDIVWWIFKNPLLASIRSFDKSLVYVPFFIFIIFTLNIRFIKNNISKSIILIILVISQMYLSYPLWSGQVPKYYSFLLDRSKGQSYAENDYATLVKIPDDYFEAFDLINEDTSQYRVFIWPYSALIPGFADYPGWGVRSFDPTIQLLNEGSIQMNTYAADFETWNYGKLWNTQNTSDSTWIMDFGTLLDIKYIVWHKDIVSDYVEQTKPKIEYYIAQGYIKEVFTGDSVNVYEVVNPVSPGRIYIPKKIYNNIEKLENIPEFINEESPVKPYAVITRDAKLNYTIPTLTPDDFAKTDISYKRNNSVNYEVTITTDAKTYPVIFSEKYYGGWEMFDAENNKVEKHFLANGYANGWLIENADCNNTCTFRIEFTPHRTFLATFYVSVTMLILSILGVFRYAK